MPGLRSPLAVVAASLALLCGCGETHVVGSDRTLQVGLTEYHLTPQNVRTTAGGLTILVHNYGRLTHDLVLSLGGHPEGSTKPIAPGQTAALVITLAPGKYLLDSTILQDQALGAYGTLTVTS
jgi:hypothetical protein